MASIDFGWKFGILMLDFATDLEIKACVFANFPEYADSAKPAASQFQTKAHGWTDWFARETIFELNGSTAQANVDTLESFHVPKGKLLTICRSDPCPVANPDPNLSPFDSSNFDQAMTFQGPIYQGRLYGDGDLIRDFILVPTTE